MKYEKQAREFVQAIKTIASKPGNLDNFESYLSYHFREWLEKYGSTPESITEEIKEFANMEI